MTNLNPIKKVKRRLYVEWLIIKKFYKLGIREYHSKRMHVMRYRPHLKWFTSPRDWKYGMVYFDNEEVSLKKLDSDMIKKIKERCEEKRYQ